MTEDDVKPTPNDVIRALYQARVGRHTITIGPKQPAKPDYRSAAEKLADQIRRAGGIVEESSLAVETSINPDNNTKEEPQ
ncbi:MAG: hypothetical protein DLM71_06450 [Chloroflexi bacterium]|nr:MAG: hypothetical protein DLM71_06450 [Chloroflexota bacterium]